VDIGSKTSSETLLVDARDPAAPARPVRAREPDVEYSVDDWGDRFVVVTNLDARDFRVCTASHEEPGDWHDFVAHRPGWRIVDFECFAGHAVMSRWEDAQQRLHVVGRDATTRPLVITDEPHEVELDANPEWDTDEIRISWQSLMSPPTIAAVDRSGLTLRTLKTVEVPGVDLSRYVSERVWAEADDGTPVPLDVVRSRDASLDGTAPCLVYVYGSY